MKRAASCFGVVAVILLITAAAFTFLAPRFGWRVDAVSSGSMEPELMTGGVVVTRPVEAADIVVGDVITFYPPHSADLTTHRVLETGGNDQTPNFRTKGDANEDADPYILVADNLVGKVCYHLPYFGYAAQFIKTPLGMMLTLCLPGLMIVIMEIRNIWLVVREAEA